MWTVDWSLVAVVVVEGMYCVRMEEMNADVEPLPFVPAMCMRFRRLKSDGYI